MSNNLHLLAPSGFRSIAAPTLFGELDIELRNALLRNAQSRRFSDGQIIQQRGDDPDGFWVIRSGTVKVGQFRLDGEFRSIALLSDGDSYGELAMFAGNRRAVDSIAEGEVELSWVSAANFDRLVAGDPDAMRRLVRALAIQLQEVIGLVAGLGSGTSRARIAAVLANLAGSSGGSSKLMLGQQDLAELTGLTRATVNKCLGELEAEGALKRHYGWIEIVEREDLLSHAADG